MRLIKISFLVVFCAFILCLITWKPLNTQKKSLDLPKLKALLKGTNEDIPELSALLSPLKKILPPLNYIGFLTDAPADQLSSDIAQFERVAQRILCPSMIETKGLSPVAIFYTKNVAMEDELDVRGYGWVVKFADGFGIVRKKP